MNSIRNHVCPGCTLLCDDLEVTRATRVGQAKPSLQVQNACELGQAFFQMEVGESAEHFAGPKSIGLEEALERGAKLLDRSRSPLITGLDALSTQAQQAAWAIADRLQATIDTTLTNQGRGSLFSLQAIGKVTATLGEIASRSDVIVFWFCDPQVTHPRLIQRLRRAESESGFDRQLIVVDESESETGRAADRFFQLPRRLAAPLLSALRAAISDRPYDSAVVANILQNLHEQVSPTAQREDLLSQLAEKLTSASYGSFIYGQVDDDSELALADESLNRLVRSLNDHTRFVSLKLRHDGNAISGENVLTWSSGFPFAINYANRRPEFHWLEHSAEHRLQRGECDAVLLATGVDVLETFAGLPAASLAHLAATPKLLLSQLPLSQTPWVGSLGAEDVFIQVGIPGMTDSGELCRLDDVSFGVRALTEAGDFPGAQNVLAGLAERIGQLK